MPGEEFWREIKKSKPFDSPAQEAALSLWRAADQLGLKFARLFRENGITHTQYNVLRILRGAGRPLPCLEIAERMIAAVPGITGLVDRLEAMGLVARERSAEDRRVIYVGITEEGLQVLGRLDEPVRGMHESAMAHMDRHEIEALIGLLEKVRKPGDSAPEAKP